MEKDDRTMTSKVVPYNGLNDLTNFVALRAVKQAMQFCDQSWYDTFFSMKKMQYYDWSGLESILNFYKPFKTGQFSFNIGEGQWSAKKEIDDNCRKQMNEYYSFIEESYLNNSSSLPLLDSDVKLSISLLNQIYNKLTSGGGHTPSVWISDFIKPARVSNGINGLTFLDSDIDWDVYNEKMNRTFEINTRIIKKTMNLKSYLVTLSSNYEKS